MFLLGMYWIHDFTGFRIPDFTGSLIRNRIPDSDSGSDLIIVGSEWIYNNNILFCVNGLLKILGHLIIRLICLCSGFNFSPDSGIYRISKIRSEFRITGIPVASLVSIACFLLKNSLLKDQRQQKWKVHFSWRLIYELWYSMLIFLKFTFIRGISKSGKFTEFFLKKLFLNLLPHYIWCIGDLFNLLYKCANSSLARMVDTCQTSNPKINILSDWITWKTTGIWKCKLCEHPVWP